MADGPAMLGPYVLEGLLGEGGIGQVYAAQDTVLGRKVAIKMLRPELSRDANFVERFYAEAKSLGTLNHTNITTIYALHREGPDAYMVMELVHGYTIEALLAQVKRLTLRDALAVLAQTVAGIRYAHRRGLIHRDIKPANLMLTDDGLIKVMDFGIARVQGSQHLTRVGEFCGTFVYASPEQIRGDEVDERSDLYSLAIVFYRMLAGAAPFAATNEYALMTAQLQTPPPPLAGRVPDLDDHTEQVLMQALAKRPEDRFASVEEFGKAIGAMSLRGESVEILTQLYARAFDPSEDMETTRVVGSRPRYPVTDPTMPSNRGDWQLPSGTGSLPSMVMSRPSVAAPVASRTALRQAAEPALAQATELFRPASAPQPAPQRSSRAWLMGAAIVAVPLLAGGGYYLTTADHGAMSTNQASLQPHPAAADPAPPPEPKKPDQDVSVTPTPAPPPVVPVKIDPAPISTEITPPAITPPSVTPANADPAPIARIEPAPPPPPAPPGGKISPVPPLPPIATIGLIQPPPAVPTKIEFVPPPIPPAGTVTQAPQPDLPPVVVQTGPPPAVPDQPKPTPTPTILASLDPKPPEPAPVLGPQAPTPLAKPEGEPDLLGKVSGAKGLDEIEIAGRWIKIHGIVDNSRGAGENTHVQALLRYLRPAHNIVVCYRRVSDTYRCYADGHDIALLALSDGMVRLAPNAPAEYRAIFAQKR